MEELSRSFCQYLKTMIDKNKIYLQFLSDQNQALRKIGKWENDTVTSKSLE